MFKAVKGFAPDMTCRGYRYKPNAIFTEDEGKISLCEFGFHACENPLAVFEFKPPAESIYYRVHMAGRVIRSQFKSVCSKLYVTHPMSLFDIARDFIEWAKTPYTDDELKTIIKDNVFFPLSKDSIFKESIFSNDVAINKARRSMAYSQSTHESVAATTNDYSVSFANLGRENVSCSTGLHSVALSSSCSSVCASTGIASRSEATNDHSISANTGENGLSIVDGFGSIAATTAQCSVARADGDMSIAVSSSSAVFCDSLAIAGHRNSVAVTKERAMGVVGSHLVFFVYCGNNKTKVYTFDVDGETVKENTIYRCSTDGELIEYCITRN